VFGGWDRPGTLSDAVLQLAAVPLLLWSLARLIGLEISPPVGTALAFCLALVGVPLLQLVPLPPDVWTALPVRDVVERSLNLAGQDQGWRPLSLTPHATWLSFLSLIPPLALFFATLLLSWRARRGLVLVALGIGVVSCFLGLLQVAQGPGGWLKDIGLASSGDAEGFFVNRNLFAAFLYSLLLLTAPFVIDSTQSLAAGRIREAETRLLVTVVASFTVLVALLAALMMARSRAGLGLSIVALFGIAAMASADSRQAALGPRRLVGGAVALVLLFASQFALYRVMERFAADPLADARFTLARITWEATQVFLPLGSGLGSFVPVYQFFETPKTALVDIYVNRAHNDVLEVGLETGLLGFTLMALFVLWFGVRFFQVWRSDGWGTPFTQLLVRAATLVIVLLMAHSLVDYPLRTTAMMAIFALACGLLFEPLAVGDEATFAWERSRVEGDDRRDGHAEATGRHTPAPQARSGMRERGPLGPGPSGDIERAALDPSVGETATARSEVPSHEAWDWPVETSFGPGTGDQRPEPVRPSVVPPASLDAALDGGTWGADMEWPESWRTRSDAAKRREGPDEE
jgi:O-antigen ligase